MSGSAPGPFLTGMCAALLAGPACKNDCGTYSYKGVRGTEWCGDVYGTEGEYFAGEPDVSSALLEFGHSVPPDRFDFSHSGVVQARFLLEDLDSREPLGADRVWTLCRWTDFGDPRFEDDDVLHEEPAVEVEIEGHGRGFNLDYSEKTQVRDVSWHIVCGDGIIRLDARDNVKLDFAGDAQALQADLADWLDGDDEPAQ